jgi:alpha-beta hydrolase superfamily lysophospholipase
MSGPAWLYLHGFASSPLSTKARAFQAWGASRDLAIDALDLRVPSFENLRFSAIKTRVRRAIDESAGPAGEPHARAVLIGSSLGGLTACRVAEEDPRVCAVLAMAPAFRLAERWKTRMTAEAWDAWRRDGFLEVDDHATKQRSRVDFGFVDELERLDVGMPDVRVPVLIVHGRADEVVDIDRSRAFAEGKRHVRLVEVDDGHELGASIPRILAEADAFFATFLGARTPRIPEN